MMEEGKIALLRFPQSNTHKGKLRPVLILRKIPSNYNDWLVCMISTQLGHKIDNFDEIIKPNDQDFKASGLKSTSLLRITRLAVIEKSFFLGIIGNISSNRLRRIKTTLSEWIAQ